MMVRPSNALRVGAVLAVAASAATVLAQRPGDLVVTPTRITLDSKLKVGDVTLVNRGSQSVRYRITLIDMEMSEDGVLKRVTSKPEWSGGGILRVSPREIALLPGESQRIKVLATFPSGTKNGEYRSHLAFEPISTRIQPPTVGPVSDGLSINLELRSGVTIPVIARFGPVAATAALSDATVSRDTEGWYTRFKISRTGNRSVRGDISVNFVPAGGGAMVLLGKIVSLPVYFPNTSRLVKLKLLADVTKLGQGVVEIGFLEQDRPRGSAALTTLAVVSG